ncbi:pilus assembly protein PilM [Xylophilus sp. GOD-11R]|nr:pilus assembly protein PilM [Xylophilus sp. GOD-11R]WPB59353.1 pilus assembly protein PilM [Xylophilus sp. GOD-11R]
MALPFSRQAAPLLGIDISTSSIKLVELGREKDGTPVLERCAIEVLDKGWIVDGNVERFDDVSEALRRLVKKSGTRTRNVAMALPSSAVITKKIVVPGGLSELDLEVQVESEASQYIPFSLDEVSLDFCVIGASPGAAEDIEVLIAASRKEKVQDRQGLAEAAGLRPQVLDIESHAARLAAGRLIGTLPQSGHEPIVALLKIGGVASSLQVMRNEEVVYERDQAFGGSQLTQLIVRQYGFSAEEAEIKKRNADLPDDYATAVLAPFVDSISTEIGRALQFFFTSSPYNQVDHILLSGGSACLPGLAEAVAAQSGFSCTVANPFDGMKVGSGIRSSARTLRDASSYLTACGLAMRRFLP